MGQFHVIAYEAELSERDVETISALCGDILIERIENRSDNNLHTAIELGFDKYLRNVYRLNSSDVPEVIMLAGELPFYIGKLDESIERDIECLISLYFEAQGLLRQVDDIKDSGEMRFYDFQEYFKEPSNIITVDLEPFEDQIQADMHHIQKAMVAKLEECRLK